MAASGLISLPSPHPPEMTLDRLAAEVTARGLTVFGRIDHAAAAADAGRPPFCRLKQFRAIATRYDKRAVNFLAGVYAASSLILFN